MSIFFHTPQNWFHRSGPDGSAHGHESFEGGPFPDRLESHRLARPGIGRGRGQLAKLRAKLPPVRPALTIVSDPPALEEVFWGMKANDGALDGT